MGFNDTKFGFSSEDQIQRGSCGSSVSNDGEHSDEGNASNHSSLNPEINDRTAEKASGPTPDPEITREWVMAALARNAQIASAKRPLTVPVKLIPRDPEYGSAIVREIEIYSQDIAASNQSLTQIGKSLAMFKGECEPKVVQEIWAPMTEEKYRKMARLATRRADQMAEAAKNKKADGNGK